MAYLDCNCFVGSWPFYRVRKSTFSDLRFLHKQNGISGGFVSSLEAIFWNDPWEAETILAEAISHEPAYRHVMTVVPTLSGMWHDLLRARDALSIAGVRLLPGFHDYALEDECIRPLFDFLRSNKLPLFLTLRMENERITHMFRPRELPLSEVRSFLENEYGFPIIICNVRDDELTDLAADILSRDDVFVDTSGSKPILFALEERIAQRGLLPRIVYGSGAPLNCMASSMLYVQTSSIQNTAKEAILTGESLLQSLR